MKRLLAIPFLLLLAVQAFAAKYDIDASHSGVMFKVKHLAISTVTGRFEKFSGTFEYDSNNVAASKVEATIEAASINTDQEKRDEHLRNADFFDVEKFPTLTFVSKEITNISENGFDIVGDLTMRGVTKSVTLKTELGGLAKDPWGNNRVAFTATTAVSRKDFGLTWNKVMESGGLVVGDEIKIILEVEAVQQKPEEKSKGKAKEKSKEKK